MYCAGILHWKMIWWLLPPLLREDLSTALITKHEQQVLFSTCEN